jgi:hypothetical protein
MAMVRSCTSTHNFQRPGSRTPESFIKHADRFRTTDVRCSALNAQG